MEAEQMSPEDMVYSFNEWMRRYIEEPERFEQEWATIREFLDEEENGEEPSYGASCTALMFRYLSER